MIGIQRRTEPARKKLLILLGILLASSVFVLAGSSIQRVSASAQPIPPSEYFGNAYNSTAASLGRVELTNTTQIVDMRFTARYSGDVVPRVSVGIDYFLTSAKYDVVVGIQTDKSGNPSGQFLGAFVWNVTSGLCNGCGGWVYPGFAPRAYNLNHTISLVSGAVYHLVVEYLNGTFTNTGGCYGTDCITFEYIGGTNFQQESLDMHYDPNQALLACGNIGSCNVVPGANAVYALDINGSAWWQGQTESLLNDAPIGAAKGGTGLDSFEGERFWMAWNSVTVNQLRVFLSKIGRPTGSLNLLVWNFTAPSAAGILSTSHPQLMLNESVIPNLQALSTTGDTSYNFGLTNNLVFEYGNMYQISFAIYGNTSVINGGNEAAVEVTNSNFNSNPLNWDGWHGSPSCPQYPDGCAGFRYTGSTDNSASEEWGYEDLAFLMKIVSTAVAQPMSVQMGNAAPPSLVSIEGCHASPSTFPSDGAVHSVSIDPSCSFSLSFNNVGTTRAGFQVNGAFSASYSGPTSCSSGSCQPLSVNAFDQVQNTFRATPATPSTWDAGLQIPVTGTQLGSQGLEGCTISTTAGSGRVGCTSWFDYGTEASVADPVPVSGSERWAAYDQTTFLQTSGGHNYTVDYTDQFNVAFVVEPPGSGTTQPSNASLWENYGPVSINETANPGFGFVSWTVSGTGITLADPQNSSTTATVQGSGTITANFESLVTQPIAISTAGPGGQPGTFLVSGCDVSPTSLLGNGTSVSFSALPSCAVVLSAPPDAHGLRYRFDVGGQAAATISFQTCVGGSCPNFASEYYVQVQETFAYSIVGGGAPPPPSLTYTSLGANTTQAEAPSPVSVWVDYGTRWSVSGVLAGAFQTERWTAPSSTPQVASAAEDITTTYQHQYSISVTASPASCGATTPSGQSWEPTGLVFSIQASASAGCTFGAWGASPGISIAEPTLLNSTVSAQAPGTITASFAKSALSSAPAVPQIYLGAGVAAVICLGLVLVIVVRRRRRPTVPI